MIILIILTFILKIQSQILSQKTVLDSTIADIIWCTQQGDDKIVIILTTEGTIYKSKDKGFSWEEQIRIFQDSLKRDALSTPLERIKIKEVILNPHLQNSFILVGDSDINWITENGLETVRAMNHGRPVKEFQFHPTQKKWLLATAWTLCEDFIGQCLKYKELHFSDDLGESWNRLTKYVYQFGWGAKTIKLINTSPEERIIVAYDPKGTGNQSTTKKWNENIRVSYSDNFFETTQPIMVHGNRFLISNSYFFVARAVQENKGELLISKLPQKEEGYAYFFKEIELPTSAAGHLDIHSYTILESKEQTFLHINHEGPFSKYGNIYKSDSTGLKYSFSLRSQIRSSDGQTDFQKLSGLDGIILANIYDDVEIQQIQKEMFALDSIKIQQNNPNSKDLDNYKITMITFDNGGIWQRINAPLKDGQTDGNCRIEQNCSLHLNSYSTGQRFGPVYSTKNSIGLVISTGNLGKYLQRHPDQINTYQSLDGGRNWKQIRKGSRIYEVGDHGSIVLMASDQTSTNVIEYSWDEGQTFQEYILPVTQKIQIKNIIIEPTNTGTNFLVIGELRKTGRGIIVSLDFSQLFQQNCAGADSPDTPNSDYMTYTVNEQCLLGRKTTYIKKKIGVKCFNGEQFEKAVRVENCACTDQDWECDVGFIRDAYGVCVKEDGSPINYKQQEGECYDYYQVSQGYRKVAGDTCEGGINRKPIFLRCTRYTNKIICVGFFVIGSILSYLLLKDGKKDQPRKSPQKEPVLKNADKTLQESTNVVEEQGLLSGSDDSIDESFNVRSQSVVDMSSLKKRFQDY